MTNREYIIQKMAAFQVNEALLADISEGIDLDAPYTGDPAVGRALIKGIEEAILQPYMSSVSESGFSVSWNRDNIGRWYRWLCQKYGVTVNSDALASLGVSSIIDISDTW